jgi:murein peptide amidase A
MTADPHLPRVGRPSPAPAFAHLPDKADSAGGGPRSAGAVYVEPLFALAAECTHLTAAVAGEFTCDGRPYALHRFRFAGPDAGHEPIRLGVFAGVHGDEPAGCAALVEFLAVLAAEPARAAGYDLFVYPVVNPTGCEDATRTNRAGKDLNREFWRCSSQPEVQIIERELRAHVFAGLITLHADDTSEGHYGYSHGRSLDDALLQPALLAAERVLPRDRRTVIDGFTAREGVICDCFHGVLSAPHEQEPRPFNVIFETPAQAPLELQVAANVAALEAILSNYRGYIAYAQAI